MIAFSIEQRTLKNAVAAFQSLVGETLVTCNDGGLEMVCVDAAHVCMSKMTIPSSALEDYVHESDRFGLDLAKIGAFLRLTAPGDRIRLAVDDDEGRCILSSGNITRRMAILDTATMILPTIPNMGEFAVSVETDTETLADAIKGVQDIDTDAMVLTAKQGRFSVSTVGDTDSADYTMDIPVSGDEALASYPKDYMVSVSKAIPPQSKVSVEFTTDFPTRIRFARDDMEGYFLIAPRIEEQ